MQTIPVKIALTRLVELAEYELLSPAVENPPEAFHADLRAAVKTVKPLLASDPGTWFYSAGRINHRGPRVTE